jgi:urea transport system permease protein
MVIFAAVGGRMSLLGAVYGTLLVNFGKTYFSETLPELWLFLMGGLFITVVMYFPNGLAGLYDSHGKPWFLRLWHRLPMAKNGVAADKAATIDTNAAQVKVST